MAVQLEQSPFLSLISQEQMRRTLALMGQPADAHVNAEVAREICERSGATAVIEGSITTLGSQFVLGVRAKNCHTGDVLDEEQEQVARKEDVLSALSSIVRNFRSRVGESLATVQKYSTPLAEATTPSLEALKAYSAGWQIHALHGASAALPFFRRATEIDPQFAMAYASLGRLYADLDQPGLAAASLAQAWQQRGRASEHEKYFITSNYEILATGNLEAAEQTCEAWARAYPRDARPHHAMSGIVQKAPGRYEKALEEAQKAIALEPDFWVGYYSLGVDNLYLGRTKESENALHTAIARGLDADEFIMLAHDIDFLKDDKAGMQHEEAQARARPGGENWMSARESFVAGESIRVVGRCHEGHSSLTSPVPQPSNRYAKTAGQLRGLGAAIRNDDFEFIDDYRGRKRKGMGQLG